MAKSGSYQQLVAKVRKYNLAQSKERMVYSVCDKARTLPEPVKLDPRECFIRTLYEVRRKCAYN